MTTTATPEFEQLLSRVRDLEARLEARTAPAPAMLPIAYRPDPVYTPPVTTTIASLMASGPLRYCSVREVRQLSCAVALARGDMLPGGVVPVSYEGPMLELAAARAEGLTWHASFERCGLTPPDDGEVAHQARTLRAQLRGLWDGLESLLGPLQTVVNPVAWQNFVEYLRRLLV